MKQLLSHPKSIQKFYYFHHSNNPMLHVLPFSLTYQISRDTHSFYYTALFQSPLLQSFNFTNKSKLVKKLSKNISYSNGYSRKEVIFIITETPSTPLILFSSLHLFSFINMHMKTILRFRAVHVPLFEA